MSLVSLSHFREIAKAASADARVDLDESGGGLKIKSEASAKARFEGFSAHMPSTLGRSEEAVNAFYSALQAGFGQSVAQEALKDLKGIQIKSGKLLFDSPCELSVGAIDHALKIADALHNKIGLKPVAPVAAIRSELKLAIAEQHRVWDEIFGVGASMPTDLALVRQQLTDEVSRRGLDPSINNAIQSQLDVVDKFTDAKKIPRNQALAAALKGIFKSIHGFDVDLAIELSKANWHKGAQVGKGGLGSVSDLELDGKPKLYKEFLAGKSYPILLDPKFAATQDPKLSRSQELTAAFLHDHEKDLVVAPTHFVVRETNAAGSKDYLVAVGDKELRAWAKHRLLQNSDASGKANPGYTLEIVGQVQDKAKGVELLQFINNYIFNPGLKPTDHLNAIALGLVDALSVLERRGFVHGDLKFANVFYDATGKKLSLIDTGGLSKVAKDPVNRPNTFFGYERGVTTDYTVQSDGVMGVEQDWYSVGIMLLEISAYCEATGATQSDAINKLEKFKAAASAYTVAAIQGHEDPDVSRFEVNELLDNSFPITGSKIENAGIAAIKTARVIATDRVTWNHDSNRAAIQKGLDVLKNILTSP